MYYGITNVAGMKYLTIRNKDGILIDEFEISYNEETCEVGFLNDSPEFDIHSFIKRKLTVETYEAFNLFDEFKEEKLKKHMEKIIRYESVFDLPSVVKTQLRLMKSRFEI